MCRTAEEFHILDRKWQKIILDIIHVSNEYLRCKSLTFSVSFFSFNNLSFMNLLFRSVETWLIFQVRVELMRWFRWKCIFWCKITVLVTKNTTGLSRKIRIWLLVKSLIFAIFLSRCCTFVFHQHA